MTMVGVQQNPHSSGIIKACPSDCLMSYPVGVLTLCIDAVCVFYSPSRQGHIYEVYIALLANAFTQAETLLYSLERAAAGISLHVTVHKTEYMCFNQTGDISTLNGSSLKLVDKFTYQGSSVSSTETDINTRLAKTWTANNRQSVI